MRCSVAPSSCGWRSMLTPPWSNVLTKSGDPTVGTDADWRAITSAKSSIAAGAARINRKCLLPLAHAESL